MARFALAAALCSTLAACATEPDPHDVTGPYTGSITRYVVDGFMLPTTGTIARTTDGDDLDGDQYVDNQLGSAFGSLAAFGNLTTHAPDMIASGALASTVEIQADDLANDDTARVWYYGSDGDAAEAAGGILQRGAFVSNRTRTTHVPGTARLRLPVFVDTDPIEIDLFGMEIDLAPDGRSGFDALIRGAVREADAKQAAYAGIRAMFAAAPDDHRTFWVIVDRNRDGVLPFEEMMTGDAILASMLAADVPIRLRDGSREDMLSIGFRVHLSPCPSGSCAPATIADRCHDRVVDGDETDLDCGGSCDACAGGEHCDTAPDCQTQTCTAGTCSTPTCTDGIRDGFESDVDCGGGCRPCATGRTCETSSDCTSSSCINSRCN